MRHRSTASKFEAERRKRDEAKPVAALRDDELWSILYRLQGRRDPALRSRIAEIVSEQERRNAR